MEKEHWFERLKELVEECLFSGRYYPYQDPQMPEMIRLVGQMVHMAHGLELRHTGTILSYGHVGVRLNLLSMGQLSHSVEVMVKPSALCRFEMELVELSKEMFVKTVVSDYLQMMLNDTGKDLKTFHDVQTALETHKCTWKIANMEFFYTREQITLGEIYFEDKDFVETYGEVIILQGDEVSLPQTLLTDDANTDTYQLPIPICG